MGDFKNVPLGVGKNDTSLRMNRYIYGGNIISPWVIILGRNVIVDSIETLDDKDYWMLKTKRFGDIKVKILRMISNKRMLNYDSIRDIDVGFFYEVHREE